MPKCVIIKWKDVNNKDYSDRNAYSVTNYNYNAEFLPIDGLSENMEALIRKDFAPIEALDSRYFINQAANYATNEPDPEYQDYKQYVFTYVPVATDKETRKICVDEAERNAINQIMPIDMQIKNVTKWMGIMKKCIEGGTLTSEQQACFAEVDNYALPIWQNHSIAIAKKQAIDEGIDIDIDADWVTSPINEQ